MSKFKPGDKVVVVGYNKAESSVSRMPIGTVCEVNYMGNATAPRISHDAWLTDSDTGTIAEHIFALYEEPYEEPTASAQQQNNDAKAIEWIKRYVTAARDSGLTCTILHAMLKEVYGMELEYTPARYTAKKI